MNKANWDEVMRSSEAKSLQALAETRYKIRRKFEARYGLSPSIRHENVCDHRSHNLQTETSNDNICAVSTRFLSTLVAQNRWQLAPETIWWDSKIGSLTADCGSPSRKDTRSLMLFLEIIHPLSHTFYLLSSHSDRNWLLNRLLCNKALYNAALSVSICFENSLTQPPKTDDIGISPEVRSLQSKSIHELRTRIDEFAVPKDTPIQEYIYAGVELLDVILNLMNLEIFSMLQGSWEMHHRAARTLLNHIETYFQSKTEKADRLDASSIEFAIGAVSSNEDRRRSLQFCITNFVWIDVVATITFGLQPYAQSAFDYLPLLQTKKIKPQEVMGCQGWVMAIMVEITKLEQLKAMQHGQTYTSNTITELMIRAAQLMENLNSGITKLENHQDRSSTDGATLLQEDCRLVTIVWGYAAQILLQVLIFDTQHTQPDSDQALIDICLQKLEELPTRLVMRVHWPYTIAGCMSVGEQRHERFRWVLGKTLQQAQAPGVTWKGLMVMEECWRLRQIHRNANIGWREAMDSMSARVLLI